MSDLPLGELSELIRQGQEIDTLFPGAAQRIDWDHLRTFLAVTSAGSFKAASRVLGQSVNTVRNHVKRLEDISGVCLLERSHLGVRETEAGSRLAAVAKEMASATLGVGLAGGSKIGVGNHVRFSVTEGLGTFWMVPRLADFQRRFPGIRISLNCTMEPVRHCESSDSVALQLVRPEDPNLVCIRLGTLHLLPFASESYLREYGTPNDISEVRLHRLVVQTGEQLNNSILTSLFGEQPPDNLIALETNTSSAHYWAIAKGIGIGMLPTYARAITRTVKPLDIGLRLRRDVWLAYPASSVDNRSTKTVIGWIKESFNPAAYPWFAEDFVHPEEFDSSFSGTNVVRLFAGFMDLPAQMA